MIHEAHDPNVLRTEFLSGRDVPCPHCGYNLRNTRSDRCAECGTLLELGLRARPRIGLLVLCIVAIVAPFGFTATVAAPGWKLLIEQLGRHGIHDEAFRFWSKPDWFNFGLSNGLALFCLLLVRVFVWRSGWFLRLRRRWQWLFAIGCWVLSIALLIGVVYAYGWAYNYWDPYRF